MVYGVLSHSTIKLTLQLVTPWRYCLHYCISQRDTQIPRSLFYFKPIDPLRENFMQNIKPYSFLQNGLQAKQGICRKQQPRGEKKL